MEKNIEEFMEALDASKKYEEGLGDVVHKAGTAIKNFFGTKAGAAQRAVQDAKTNAQTMANQKQADDINAQNVQGMPDDKLAVTLNKAIEKAIKIANDGLQQLQNDKQANQAGKPVENNNEQQNNVQQEQTNEQPQNTQEKQQEALFRRLLALQEAEANKNQKYYKTAIKNLQDIQNLVKPVLTGQKEFDKDTLKSISDKINDQSVQGVLGKNDKKALKAIQQINSTINTKIKSLDNKQQQTQNNSNQQNSQQSADNQTQNSADGGQQQNANNSQQPGVVQSTQNQDQQTQDNSQQQAQDANTQQNKDPAQMQPEEIAQQPEGQQASKEYEELAAAIDNLVKKFGNNKAIRTLGNAWETFKSMNSKGGADKILQ